MDITDEIRTTLANQPQPICVQLTPFEILQAESDGYIKVAFAPQPAFGNHFGNIQGGFAVSMIDLVTSTAAYIKTGQWLPTVEIKTSFIAPAKIGTCLGEGQVIRAGRNIVFVESKLWNDNSDLSVHATATLLGPKS